MIDYELKQALLCIFSYYKESGTLLNKVNGKTFGGMDCGRVRGCFLRRKFYLSNLIWLLETGKLPDTKIYHINGDKLDTRFKNLKTGVQSREEMLAVKNIYRENNRDSLAKKQKEHALKNKEYYKNYYKNYYAHPDNQECLRISRRRYMRRRYREDNCFKSAVACRNVLKRLIRQANILKSGRTEQQLGYSYEQFKKHIESKFENWMNWDNYGDWHIDHMKPVSLYIKEGIIDPKIINNLDNLQPLAAKENRLKSDNY